VLIFCPRCNGALPSYLFHKPQVDIACPTCTTALRLTLFPALFRPAPQIDPQSLLTAEGDATSFEHTTKRAVAVCHKCGRFLCALCEVQIAGQVWCPSCLIPANSPSPIQALEKRRTLFDSIALALATLPAMLIYPAFLAAPTAVYLSIRYWKKPSSIVPRGKWRFVLALLFALAELGLMVFGIAALLFVQQNRTPVVGK
jgi:hypothetical protein